MSVTWVQNGSSQFEVSSKDHLLQIMTQGTYSTDAGTPPASAAAYWSSSFIQTVDIDLANDANITPIGTSSTKFTGQYDGDSYSISNWLYTTATSHPGLFGYTNTGCILKNMRLAGIWNMDVDFTGHGGFLCAQFENSSAYNIEGDFDVGTYFGPTTSNYVQAGTMIGYAKTCTLQGFVVKGSVDMDDSSTNNRGQGGVFGNTEKSYVKFIQNVADFPSGIKNPFRTAGICAFSEQDYEWSNVQCAMTGDIWSANPGGIFGYIRLGSTASPIIDNIVLSMTGNIMNAAGSSASGGAFAYQFVTAYIDTTLNRFVNYMTGDCSSGTASSLFGSFDLTIQNSIIAPNGTLSVVDVSNSSSNSGVFTETTKYDESFGLTFSINNGGSSDSASLTGFLTHASFTELPYIDLSGTDDEGNSYDWDFIYGNVGGNATEYPLYTHAVLHKGDMIAPFVVDYDTVASGFDGTSLQLTFANTTTDTVYVQLAFTVTSTTAGTTTTWSLPAPLTVVSGVLTAEVTLEDSGATAYRISITPDGGSEVVSVSTTTELIHTISNLSPVTNYTVSLYTDTGAGFVSEASESITTLANISGNYDKTDYDDGSGGFDLSEFNDTSLGHISEVMDSLFTTGDSISLEVDSIVRDTTFSNVAGTLTIDKLETEPIISVGFDGLASQTTSVNLTDEADVSTTYGIVYDGIESDPTYSINGGSYKAGQSLVLNGKKVTIFNF